MPDSFDLLSIECATVVQVLLSGFSTALVREIRVCIVASDVFI